MFVGLLHYDGEAVQGFWSEPRYMSVGLRRRGQPYTYIHTLVFLMYVCMYVGEPPPAAEPAACGAVGGRGGAGAHRHRHGRQDRT